MGHLPKGNHLYIQTERVQRWYNRICEINSGTRHGQSFEMDIDEFLVFFIFCYHLKDWIIKETHISRQVTEEFIKKTRCLAICADIANGTKHLGVGDVGSKTHPPRSREDFRMRECVMISGDQAKPNILIDFDDGTQVDAMTLATKCMEAWAEFLKTHPPDSSNN